MRYVLAFGVLVMTVLPTMSYGQAGGGGASANPGIFIPNEGAALWKYFSGTLNYVAATAYVYGPDEPGQEVYMTKLQMFLGDGTLGFPFVEVAAWEHIPGEPTLTTAVVDAVFDSTHFPNNFNLHVTVTGNDNLDRPWLYGKNELIKVKNKALIGNHDFKKFGITPPGSQSHDEVSDALSSVSSGSSKVGKYSVVKKLGNNLDFGPWKGAIPGANFIWVSTHGQSDLYEMTSSDSVTGPFMTDNPVSDPNSHEFILSASVGASFTSATYPPFNSSKIPPCNFMFADSCKTLDYDFSDVLYPKNNRYSGALGFKNMFVGGWTVVMPVSSCKVVAEVYMGHLVDGWPAYQALFYSMSDWINDEVKNYAGDIIDMSMVAYEGDPYTKVAGVYTGDNSQTLNWYR